MNTPLPQILLLVDRPNWALHTIARAIERHLSHAFAFTICTTDDPLPASFEGFDIVHAFFWGDMRYRDLLTPRTRLVISVYSHRWEESLPLRAFHDYHLADAVCIAVPSQQLLRTLQDLPIPVHLTPEGVDTEVFAPAASNAGAADRPLIAGWAGNIEDPIKQVDLIREACEGLIELHIADGGRDEAGMVEFYRGIDVILCSSQSEGCPRPLIEGMACGNFPVSFPVGIAPEMITDLLNGMLVEDRTAGGLRRALQWCLERPADIRGKSLLNVERIRATRQWSCVLPALEHVYRSLVRVTQ